MAWFIKAAGIALACAAAFGWLTLLSWSVHDPSLTHATSGATRNWLGPPGAIVSDLLLQAVGLASIFVFLACAAAGAELLLRERIPGWRMRGGPAGSLAVASRRRVLVAADTGRLATVSRSAAASLATPPLRLPPASCRPYLGSRGGARGRTSSVRRRRVCAGHRPRPHAARAGTVVAAVGTVAASQCGLRAKLACRHGCDAGRGSARTYSSPGCGPSRATARLAGSC